MSSTVEIGFTDDDGTIHRLATVPSDSFESHAIAECAEIRIELSNAEIAINREVAFAGSRIWYFRWLDPGTAGGLTVRRLMKCRAAAENPAVMILFA